MAKQDFLSVDNWPIRRRWMKVILAWAMLNVNYILIWGEANSLNETALVALVTLVAAITGSYVFGAVWDDNDKRKWKARQERIDPEMGE